MKITPNTERLQAMQNYLEKLLGTKKKARQLMLAVKARTPVLIDGPQGPTGKTTLCEALRAAGAIAYERSSMYEVVLDRAVDRTNTDSLIIFQTMKQAEGESEKRIKALDGRTGGE